MLTLPVVNIFLCDILFPKNHPRHLVWRVDDEKQRENDEIHTDEDRDGVKCAPYNVSEHRIPPPFPLRDTPFPPPDCNHSGDCASNEESNKRHDRPNHRLIPRCALLVTQGAIKPPIFEFVIRHVVRLSVF